MGISAEIEIEFDTGCGAVGQKGKNTHVSHTHTQNLSAMKHVSIMKGF